jgi:formylglycine-generating enzyme required for sulfatase activity
MIGALMIVAVLLVAAGSSWSRIAGAVVQPEGQGGGRPTPTPKPKSSPRSTPQPTPRSTPRPTPRATPRAAATPAPARRTAPQIEMVSIPAGTFMMGSPDSEQGRSSDEDPRHRVTVQSFYIGKYEVTQAQYQAVMGVNPSVFKGDDRPVENISWNEAVEFCRELSRLTGKQYRLPTEAEWEYACRAGTTTPFAFGSTLTSEQANFDGTYQYGKTSKGLFRQQTTPVGSFQPNAFGLYDMHGNVSEWCEDWYHENYQGAPADGSAWESGGAQQFREVRGGSWYIDAGNLRSADRYRLDPNGRGNNFGFRVVLSAK